MSAHGAKNRAAMECAEGRTTLLDLFADVHRHGLPADPTVRQVWESMPPVREALEGYANDDGSLNHSRLAADHYHVFGMGVLSFGGLFQHPSFSDSVSSSSAENVPPTPSLRPVVSPGEELADTLDALRDWVEEEVQCLRTGADPAPARRLQAQHLDSALLPWIIPWQVAIHREGIPLFRVYADQLTMELVSLRCTLLEGNPSVSPGGEKTSSPPQGSRLQEALLHAADCGVWVSKHQVEAIARVMGLPRGFGNRRSTLKRLHDAADHYDRGSELRAAWLEVFAAWEHSYRKIRTQIPDPLLWMVDPWIERVERFRDRLS